LTHNNNTATVETTLLNSSQNTDTVFFNLVLLDFCQTKKNNQERKKPEVAWAVAANGEIRLKISSDYVDRIPKIPGPGATLLE
jgi:hypothetical protein